MRTVNIAQVAALAGCCQSAAMVKQLAYEGFINVSFMDIAVNSVLRIDAKDSQEIFENYTNLRWGAEILLEQLYPKAQRDLETGRYLTNLISLQGQLWRNTEIRSILGDRLAQLNRQRRILEKTQEDLILGIANTYQDTISSLPLRIQVSGHARFLERAEIQNQVRASLMFGLRCAVLWHQSGGLKRHFLFRRRQIATLAQTLK